MRLFFVAFVSIWLIFGQARQRVMVTYHFQGQFVYSDTLQSFHLAVPMRFGTSYYGGKFPYDSVIVHPLDPFEREQN